MSKDGKKKDNDRAPLPKEEIATIKPKRAKKEPWPPNIDDYINSSPKKMVND